MTLSHTYSAKHTKQKIECDIINTKTCTEGQPESWSPEKKKNKSKRGKVSTRIKTGWARAMVMKGAGIVRVKVLEKMRPEVSLQARNYDQFEIPSSMVDKQFHKHGRRLK